MNKQNMGEAFVARVTEGLSRRDVLEAIARGKIASAILTRRCELGMDHDGFARHTGVSPETVFAWESGDHDFTIGELCELCGKLALVLDVSITKEPDAPR